MIPVLCVCGAKYQVPETMVGRTVRCKRCQASLAVGDAEVIDDVEVLDDAAAQPAPPAEGRVPPPRPGRKNKKRRVLTEEQKEQMEREETERRWRLTRGWAYLSSGVFTMIAGVAFTVLVVNYEKRNLLDEMPAVLTVLYKVAGIWGPTILSVVLGIIPCIIGAMNLMGIDVVYGSGDE